MDFNDTPEEARFREEAATWLAANVPTDDTFRALSPLGQAKVWQKRKYDAGWACIGWAPEFGGRGASAIEEVIWRQEESRYELPSAFFLIGQGMIAPTLMAWASDEDKAKSARTALLASRTNTMLSIPMLFFMITGSPAHGGGLF